MPPEGCTWAEILPGCPSLDRGSREAEVGFEPRTFRSVNSRSNHLGHLAPQELSLIKPGRFAVYHGRHQGSPSHVGIELNDVPVTHSTVKH
ncbi:hypothetical protein T265_05539 [Opisthorchis viverrini]|uniref:Uncharacterized protein n=1 Tax=Opisthorchis viverrini TaxID=6198 RepID=A0A074ZK59_OPIVI|nr:hypothetical protein T265_05539 [Opisthorchis viverrini]KER27436.1 hypothetical protein T265_05539 [Opisthorchis viverrini]